MHTALTIAGSDSGGGAGAQADLKTFLDFGVYGMSALTAVTAQGTTGVRCVHPVPVEVLRAQLEAVFEDLRVDAVKIGMLGSADHVATVAAFLGNLPSRPPIVLDPVMIAKGGRRLLDEAAVVVLRERLVPLASLVTPNLDEAAVLGELPVPTLLKGGHAEGDVVVDRLGGRTWRHPRQARGAHGTGCTLASAIAARLALGDTLPDACDAGITYVSALLALPDGGFAGGNRVLLHGRRPR